MRGHNIPSDQHMEHLNRILKDSIKNLGSNKTGGGFVRVGKAIGTVVRILEQYDQISSIPAVSDAHKTLVSSSDLNKLVQEFNNTHIFYKIPGRYHKSFKTIKQNCMNTVQESQIIDWIGKCIK